MTGPLCPSPGSYQGPQVLRGVSKTGSCNSRLRYIVGAVPNPSQALDKLGAVLLQVSQMHSLQALREPHIQYNLLSPHPRRLDIRATQ